MQSKGREFKDAIFSQLERVAAAFASARRLEIIDLLAQGERPVESIATASGQSVANASRHLQVLRHAGLVTSRRDAQQVIYRLSDPAVVRGYQTLRVLAESRLAEVSQLAGAFFGEVDGAEPIGLDDLQARMGHGDVVVVDVRPEIEFAAGHIDGAVNIPLSGLAERMEELPHDVTVVAYCRGPYCVLAAEAVSRLRDVGYDAARLAAGYPEWQQTGRPTLVTH